MTSVVTFAPIAAQLARSVSLDDLFPLAAVEHFLRDHRENTAQSDEPKLPDDVLPFFGHYCAVTRAAVQLLGAPAFEPLARFHDQVEDEYMPGGPPQSPVYDSFAMQFVLSSVPQGIANETPYSVLARLLLRDPSRARLQAMAQCLADSRFDLYRVKGASTDAAEVELVRGGGALSVGLTGPFLRAGDWGLMRVLQFDDRSFIADSPYLLKAREEDWRQYLARVVAQQQGAASTSAPQKASKLSSKEQARRHQKDKARAARNEPEEIIRRHLKFGPSPRYWLDYVMDAYAGERRGIVFLAGVPDRPELLPHSHEYQGASEPRLPPEGEFRRALLQTAMKEGLLEVAVRELRRLGNFGAAEAVALGPGEQSLLAAYATFGLRAADGTTVLTRFERSREAESLRPEVRAFIDSLTRGWFAVLRVDRIHLDKGLEAFDLFRGQGLQVSERSATRQLALGDLILGWLCKDPAGKLTLEGGLAHLPAFAAAPFLSLVADLRRQMPPLANEQAWKSSAADLPLPLLAGIIELRANPLPKLMNTSGDPLEPANVRARQGRAGKGGSNSQPLELSPELAAQIHQVVLTKLRSTLDEAIPQFKGKTLRQLARSLKSRPDAISWLREQERLLKSNPQLAELDLRPLWQELALPFQGIETDPPL